MLIDLYNCIFIQELKYTKDDNNNLRAKIRRLEEDNARRCKEIDNLYDTNKVLFVLILRTRKSIL